MLEFNLDVQLWLNVTLLRLLERRGLASTEEAMELAQKLGEQARAVGRMDDAMRIDSLINQLEQQFGLPAND